ncbi:MAG: substrate-binding domain-containing protein [Acidimicrobiia bacterium]|nr:substrate-binding domain-containing protein [Acidimicrobiia bacterium]
MSTQHPCRRQLLHGAWLKGLVLVAALAMLASACSGSDSQSGDGDNRSEADAVGDPGECLPIDLAVSSEKIDLLKDLAQEFNDSDAAKIDGVAEGCVYVRVWKQSSGAAMTRLASGWPDDPELPRPHVWSPASSAWGALLNDKVGDDPEAPKATDGDPIMLTPLVIAMPEPMAQAMGWPDASIGWQEILDLAKSDEGWAAYGHPEWGQFRLGKTNPNFSTSGLSSTVAMYYAATGKLSDLSIEDVDSPRAQDFARGVENAVVHYGDITMTFLNNWYRHDAQGSALRYVSAVAVEEVSVINYNKGNPDGTLSLGEVPEKPKVPLVAIYPEEGTIYSDNPYIVLDAPWVSEDHKVGAKAFEEFVHEPDNQTRVLDFGFRPGSPEVPLAQPISSTWGVDPDQPETTLEVPEPNVLSDILDAWAELRKPARVMLVLDVSGSMSEAVTGRTTKLELAVDAAINALDQFRPDDEVGLRVFTTAFTDPAQGIDREVDWSDIVPVGPMSENRQLIENALLAQSPLYGTALYGTTADSVETMRAGYADDRINAVVLLTDGRNETDGSGITESQMLETIDASDEINNRTPVRVFPIAYGEDADMAALTQIADATDAAVYVASDPETVREVFNAVISNF